ncbi:hypothetical protein BGW37DRAFT_7051 [Umbelopsis sp. PMI_123]|nr:hypothetical protein BGW37DRAFT_7051 [Umbelopsis sp. PMI_123]
MLDDVTSPSIEHHPQSFALATSPLSDRHSPILSPSVRDETMTRAPIAESFSKQRASDWLGEQFDSHQNLSPNNPQLPPSDSSRSDNRFSFLPVINPQYLRTQERSSENSTSRSSMEQQINGESISNSANEPSQKQNENFAKQPSNANYDDEGEDSDDNQATKAVPRPPPKDEKWVISSIRRPQQVPIRAQNAKMYEGVTSPVSEQTSFDQTFSTSGYSEQPENRLASVSFMRDGKEAAENEYGDETEANNQRHSKPQPNLKISIPGGQKRESVNDSKDATGNNDLMNNVRNQLHLSSPDIDSTNATRDSMMRMFGRDNNIQSGPQQYPGQGTMSQNQNQQTHMEGHTMGIRAPPWQQQSDRQNGHLQNDTEQPMSQYLTNYPSENDDQANGNTQSNLGRMNSVSGPRMPNQNLSKGSKLPPSELLSMKLASGKSQERQEWGGPENVNGRGSMYAPNNGYAYNDEPDQNVNSNKSSKKGPLDIANKMKLALRNPTDPRWPENGSQVDKANQRSSLQPEKVPSNKEGKGGRFSLAIFGKKDKESKKSKDDRDNYPISGSGSVGRAGGNQYAMVNPRQESLSYPVATSNQTFSSIPEMNTSSWQREQHQHRDQYSDVSDPPRSAQSVPQKSPLLPGSTTRRKELEDGTPVIEYGNGLIMSS